MYTRMLRSVLATAIAAAALMIGTLGTSDVGWGPAPGKGDAVAHRLADGDVGWDSVDADVTA
ncbi:hypothetical protein GCM10010381_44960 [Streptomyces xantholiticus]|nr:hypothetical protein GCM10010381_44960 [Streptomyces xantholiticus]